MHEEAGSAEKGCNFLSVHEGKPWVVEVGEMLEGAWTLRPARPPSSTTDSITYSLDGLGLVKA